jgi:hypothetical protein
MNYDVPHSINLRILLYIYIATIGNFIVYILSLINYTTPFTSLFSIMFITLILWPANADPTTAPNTSITPSKSYQHQPCPLKQPLLLTFGSTSLDSTTNGPATAIANPIPCA